MKRKTPKLQTLFRLALDQIKTACKEETDDSEPNKEVPTINTKKKAVQKPTKRIKKKMFFKQEPADQVALIFESKESRRFLRSSNLANRDTEATIKECSNFGKENKLEADSSSSEVENEEPKISLLSGKVAPTKAAVKAYMLTKPEIFQNPQKCDFLVKQKDFLILVREAALKLSIGNQDLQAAYEALKKIKETTHEVDNLMLLKYYKVMETFEQMSRFATKSSDLDLIKMASMIKTISGEIYGEFLVSKQNVSLNIRKNSTFPESFY